MVGVPRSKGCRICVQRRVKCDQTRPTCNNCKKGNRPCPGYAQDLKFQDESQRLKKRYAHTGSSTPLGQGSNSSESSPDFSDSTTAGATPETEPKKGSSIYAEPNHWDSVGLDLNKSQRRTFLGLLEGKTDHYRGMIDGERDIKFELTASGFDQVEIQDRFLNSDYGRTSTFIDHVYSPDVAQNQLIMHFRDSVTPRDGSMPAVFRNHAKWLAHLPPLTGSNPLLDSAVRAVTLVHIGRLNNSEPFVNESRPYYGQALHLLNKSLQDRKKGMSNETLCATILLSFYEMFASDNNEAWVRHAGGVSALMKARGPQRHRNGFDREIFLAYRYTLIIDAFQEDVPCFLADPGWIKVSNEIHTDLIAAGASAGVSPDRVDIFNLSEEYYQSMVGLPELAANARALWIARQEGSPPPMPRAKVLESLTQARVVFKSTFTRFEAALKKAGHAPTIQLNHKDSLIGLDYEFVNTFVSATYVGYWTVLIVLNLCLTGLQRDDAEMVALYLTENRECSLNICRSCAFMLTSSFLGPFFLIFGLRVALLVFEDAGGIECDWILRKLFDIGDRHMGIAKHVPGYRPGIGVEELISEFKARKAQIEKEKNNAFQAEFARQIAVGDIELPDAPHISIENAEDYNVNLGEQRDQFGGASAPEGWPPNTAGMSRERTPAMMFTRRSGPTVQEGDSQRRDFLGNGSMAGSPSYLYSASGPFQGMTDLNDVNQVWANQDNFDLNFSIASGSDSYPSSRHHSATPLPLGTDQQQSPDIFAAVDQMSQGHYQTDQTYVVSTSSPNSPPNQQNNASSNPTSRQRSPQQPQLRRQGSGRPWELPDMDFSNVTANMSFGGQETQQQQPKQNLMGIERFFS